MTLSRRVCKTEGGRRPSLLSEGAVPGPDAGGEDGGGRARAGAAGPGGDEMELSGDDRGVLGPRRAAPGLCCDRMWSGPGGSRDSAGLASASLGEEKV